MSIYIPKTGSKERIAFTNHRIEYEGFVWRVSGKWDGKRVKVYEVNGDITRPDLLRSAILNFIAEIDFLRMSGAGSGS